MKKSILSYIILIFGLFLTACQSKKPTISPEAKVYIDEALVILKSHSLHKNTIDWDDFNRKIYHRTENAQSVADTHHAISLAIEELKDGHSYFLSANDKNDDGPPPPVLADESVEGDIGYIRLPYCMENENAYVSHITSKMKAQDHINIKGWIVDLRGNFGGNMWPMLVAIGPILGEGTVGYFIDAENEAEPWKYNKGKVFAGDQLMQEAGEIYQLKRQNPYVAILTDSLTASSGEAIAVAFKERDKTKSFGGKTFGVSTGNKPYVLSDGSVINLTESVFADRHMNPYGKSIVPDHETSPKDAVSAAISWIQEKGK